MDEGNHVSSDTSAPERETTFYQLVGGEDGLRHLVDRFYEIMEADPAAAGIRAMHGEDLIPIREKLFAFMSGWLGGPRLFKGCVVGAHRGFAIGPDERDQWLRCMSQALAQSPIDPAVRKLLETPLYQIADFMRTRD